MSELDPSTLSLIRGFGNQIHFALENTPQEPSCQYDRNVAVCTYSDLDRNLCETIVIGAMNLLVPDMTFGELKQLISQFD